MRGVKYFYTRILRYRYLSKEASDRDVTPSTPRLFQNNSLMVQYLHYRAKKL